MGLFNFFRVRGKKHDTCRLCQEKTKLCKSHIVPEFCYDYQYDGSNRYAYVVLVPKEGNAVKKEKTQIGYREYLLCNNCEQLFSSFEHQYDQLLRTKVAMHSPFNGKYLEVDGVDCNALKLCILSIFWRVSQSSLYGNCLPLGPYDEKLRRILLNKKKLSVDEFPLLGSLVLNDDGSFIKGFVSHPYERELGRSCSFSVRSYSMVFGYCEWTVYMTDHGLPKKFEALKNAISPDGKMTLLTQRFTENEIIRKMALASIK